jgi:hypothetical protein
MEQKLSVNNASDIEYRGTHLLILTPLLREISVSDWCRQKLDHELILCGRPLSDRPGTLGFLSSGGSRPGSSRATTSGGLGDRGSSRTTRRHIGMWSIERSEPNVTC